MPVKANWVKKALQCLATSSRVDLQGETIDDLSPLGQPPLMRTLDVSCVQLSSLANLKPNPQLEVFIADDSQIATFTNFISIENVRKLSLMRTPVSREPNFILSAILVCPFLTTLNGKQIPVTIRQRAANYPPAGRALVDAGWFAVFPYPTEKRIASLCGQYRVDPPTSDVTVPDQAPASPKAPDKFEDVLATLWQTHATLVRRVRRVCRLGGGTDSVTIGDDQTEAQTQATSGTDSGASYEEPFLTEKPLLERLADILRENEIILDENDLYTSVLQTIDKLCVHHGDKIWPVDGMDENGR
jgi:Leucine-rich repeat (LRR) protein